MSDWKAERPIGLGEIAAGLGIPIGTMGSKHKRGSMPEPDGRIAERQPWWYESKVIAWVVSAGLVPADFEGDWDAVVEARSAARALRA